MNLQLRSIAERGSFDKERLTMRVIKDTDVGDFLVMRAGISGDDVTTDISNAFWFPYGKVAQGDLVVLYTRSGSSLSRPLKGGNTAHFFYWGLNEAIWGDNDKSAILLFAPQWEGKPARELKAAPSTS